MEKAITKAIEGGWKHGWEKHSHVVDKYGIRTPTKERPDMCDMYRLSEWDITSDPLFWKALGKAMGWVEYCNECSGEFDAHSEKIMCPRCAWHRFIDHLIEGKDADSFFNNLLQ